MSSLSDIWRRKNYRIALGVAAAALLWLASGLLDSGEQEESPAGRAGAGGEMAPISVRARRLEARPYTTRVTVNAHTEANRSVRMRAELDGVVAKLPVEEGRAVEKGTVICRLEAEDRPQRLERARAALRKAELDFSGSQRLRKKGLQSETELAQQEVALANARAEYERARVEMDNLEIRAPFAGVINRRAVELGDYIRRGEECATLLDLDPILVVGEVAEGEVGSLVPGAPAVAELHRGRVAKGRLRYVSQEAHAVTRAYRIEVSVDNSDGELRAGLSGQLALPTGEVQAHLINSSLLTLDDRGELGVRHLDSENRVQFSNVQLVGDGSEGVWVTGLPRETNLITVGQEYVTAGQVVAVEQEQGQSALPPPERDSGLPAMQQVADPVGEDGDGGRP
ncbi:efflux RND transporter periplasmic adaptor subunit [Microbulbifer sp. YPW16]|uniref:efflux RND transporter periplasmic adaptor subunit n=1 Tax=unclassified Microbulbifer TaxID=2619833 RepID=UPI001E5AFB80|nr:efflux RND transporter periplasmic adaptor subunit [Microbulbifer sp. YPW16]UHQ56662.1 efflux RND transporter periplasmic adaptor subunit [Microbulbifer sp. YPW16]